MNKQQQSNEERAALEVLRGIGVNLLDAAILAKEAIDAGRGRLKRARKCLQAGKAALRMQEKTVSFATAVSAALASRASRRHRTQTDLRYLTHRLMKRCPELAKRRIRSITATDCLSYLQRAYSTPRQRNKARLALSSVFNMACTRGWCSQNPIRLIKPEIIYEKRIETLTPQQIHHLLHTAAHHRGGECLAAVAIMLYAGIRPHEVERLTWDQIDLEDGIICIQPQHSKTGGARHVTIHAPLAVLLQKAIQTADPHSPICPHSWRRRWTELHKLAGWHPHTNPWQEDILRHTFASHHLATFRSYTELQFEMGHRSLELLRTRYISMPRHKWLLFTSPHPLAQPPSS